MVRASLLVIFSSLLVASVSCLDESGSLQDGHVEENFKTEEYNVAVRRFPWPTRNFKCPTMFGAYPDAEDCNYFFACVYKIATRTRCPRMTLFDKNKRLCMPMLIAVCDDSEKTTEAPRTTSSKETKFRCPNFIGTFPHPGDCSKYYSCAMFMSTLKTCPNSQLFHEGHKKCMPEDEVDCGSRENPNEPTITYQTEITTSNTEFDHLTTTDGSVSEITSERDSTSEESTPEPTTTEKPPQTAPDTNCDEDDVDCIIDDLGETPDWFDCPRDVGGYPHPASQKLFIFCLNWKPSVKKCGQDLIFSKVLMTCVSPQI